MLIGAKSDLVDDTIIDEDLLWDFRKKYRINHYYETSALTGKNIEELFEEIALQLASTL
ncbi:MAG: hypothetical protein ACXAC7_20210 [Candidatus Hodarchaeales archaeon]